jgi:hypothetical protein
MHADAAIVAQLLYLAVRMSAHIRKRMNHCCSGLMCMQIHCDESMQFCGWPQLPAVNYHQQYPLNYALHMQAMQAALLGAASAQQLALERVVYDNMAAQAAADARAKVIVQ